MKIVIAGATGTIGKALVRHLAKGHDVTVIGRDKEKLDALFADDIHKLTWQHLYRTDPRGTDVLINLCGYGISEGRWSDAVKERIISSRETTTRELVAWCTTNQAHPRFINANAVGLYGAYDGDDDKRFTEDDIEAIKEARDFLTEICLKWQAPLRDAANAEFAVTALHFGVVLQKNQGMLGKLELPYKLGLGSRLGTGRQVLSWIDIEDAIRAVEFIVEHPELNGHINITAPNAVTQSEFATTYADVLKRPLLFTTPAWFIKLIFGEMGDLLLLKGQRVYPKRLLESGFKFHYPTLKESLEHLYRI